MASKISSIPVSRHFTHKTRIISWTKCWRISVAITLCSERRRGNDCLSWCVLSFNAYDRQWLDFVVGNRRGESLWKSYDMINGGIANDRVFNTVELYAAGLINADEALQRLSYHKPNNQICILNQKIIDNHLTFIGAERI